MKQPTKYQRITVSRENVSLLATQYGVSLVMVYNALAGRTHSDNAKKIRESALKEFSGRFH